MSRDTDRTGKSLAVWLVIGALVFLGLVIWMLRTGGSIWAATPSAFDQPADIAGCSDARFGAPLDTIREVMREQNTPSVSIAIAERGRVTCEASFGFADIERQVPATPSTMYSLASISKPFTATAMMRLVEEKKIDLRQPANLYLGDAKLRAFEGRAEDATVERLLTHTAGLPLHYQFFYAGGPAVPPMDTAISRHGIIVYPPGERFLYSNFGFGVLERILERVDGRTYAEVLRRTVLDPLGLRETAVSDGAGVDGRAAAVRYGNDREALAPYTFDHVGASGVWSSARDLIRFGMFHLGHDANGRGRAISRGTRDQMQRQHAPADGPQRGRGLGWAIADVDGWRQVAHTGSMPGVATVLSLYPESDTAIVVLTNINNSQAGARMERALREAVLKKRDAHRGDAPPSQPPPTTPLQSVIGGRWSGSIHLPSGETLPLELTVDGAGTARLRAGSDPEAGIENARFTNGSFIGRTALRLVGPDAAPEDRRFDNRVGITVILRGGNRLSGWVSSISTATPAYGAVSFAVQLTKIEQTSQGTRPPATLVTSFDGLGVGFEGPHGNPLGRNPSDNSLAVGPNHVFQIVNSRFAIFDKTGKVLYGSAPTNTLFKGFGGTCEARNNGDGVVRYDQLANRWLVVMPIFRRAPERADQPPVWTARDQAWEAPPGVAGQPGAAAKLFVPPPAPPTPAAPAAPPSQPPGAGRGQQPPPEKGPYSICYAISTSPDPLGAWYRYEFLRPLFPDYPRPAVWPDGYYVPTSTGDDVIQKHVCIAERDRMLKGLSAREQCIVIDGVNFLNNADVHGTRLPPRGAPNVMMATGGTQLKHDFDDDGIYYWNVKVDWEDPSKTRAIGPAKIPVAPYRYLCDGQLTNCVPQPGTDRRLDAQGDKIMAQLVYRNVNGRESIVGVHSVAASAGGGVRWYEFAVDRARGVSLRQQGTYAPDGFYRWMASPAIDRSGNIGIGYSFGGTPHFAGQRFAARLASDPPGQLTLKEAILVEGEAAQTATMRWEDYTQTAIDPVDDCTIWYVGDYFKKDATTYSTKIGAFRLPGCRR